jgi:hypothetical protein
MDAAFHPSAEPVNETEVAVALAAAALEAAALEAAALEASAL